MFVYVFCKFVSGLIFFFFGGGGVDDLWFDDLRAGWMGRQIEHCFLALT